MLEPATAGESLQVSRCRPFHGLRAYFCDPILGLAPQALCCRSLRELCDPILGLAPQALCCRSLRELCDPILGLGAPGFMLSLAPRALLTPSKAKRLLCNAISEGFAQKSCKPSSVM